MAIGAIDRPYSRALHPLHAVLLASAFALFLAALISDLAYATTYQIQWKNFASWLIAGALVFGGVCVAWAVIDLLRADVRRKRRWVIYFLLVAAMWVLGFVDALVHAEDAWSGMPGGAILSGIVVMLALAAIWTGFSSYRATGGR